MCFPCWPPINPTMSNSSSCLAQAPQLLCNGTDGEENSFLTLAAELSALCSLRLEHTVHYLIFLSSITNGLKISQAFCKNPPTQLGPLTQLNGSVGADTFQTPRSAQCKTRPPLTEPAGQGQFGTLAVLHPALQSSESTGTLHHVYNPYK